MFAVSLGRVFFLSVTEQSPSVYGVFAMSISRMLIDNHFKKKDDKYALFCQARCDEIFHRAEFPMNHQKIAASIIDKF